LILIIFFFFLKKAIDQTTGEVIAVKIIPVEKSDLKQIVMELETLKSCQNPNITKFYGAHLLKDHLWISMEYCGGGSLADILKGFFQNFLFIYFIYSFHFV